MLRRKTIEVTFFYVEDDDPTCHSGWRWFIKILVKPEDTSGKNTNKLLTFRHILILYF